MDILDNTNVLDVTSKLLIVTFDQHDDLSDKLKYIITWVLVNIAAEDDKQAVEKLMNDEY